MALLTEQERFEVWAAGMKRNLEDYNLTKADLRAAYDATDQWISDNKASFNAAIPEPARTALTASQKAGMLTEIAAKRFIVGA
jgi:hypothetical protein